MIAVSPHAPDVFVFTTRVGDGSKETATTIPETYTNRALPKITARYLPAQVSIPSNKFIKIWLKQLLAQANVQVAGWMPTFGVQGEGNVLDGKVR